MCSSDKFYFSLRKMNLFSIFFATCLANRDFKDYSGHSVIRLKWNDTRQGSSEQRLSGHCPADRWQGPWIHELRISGTVEEKLSKIDSVVIWDPEELDLIHKTRAVDFVIQREQFDGANFDEIQGKNSNK